MTCARRKREAALRDCIVAELDGDQGTVCDLEKNKETNRNLKMSLMIILCRGDRR